MFQILFSIFKTKKIDNRDYIIDCFRFLSILLVTVVHVFAYYFVNIEGYKPYLYDGGAFFKYFNAFAILARGHGGVQIFFVISGYCMAMTSIKYFDKVSFLDFYKKFFLNRYLRIALPYFVGIVFYAVFWKQRTIKEYLISAFFLQKFLQGSDPEFAAPSIFWSLCVEMWFYVIFPFIFAFLHKKSPYKSIIALCFGVFVYFTHYKILSYIKQLQIYCFILGSVIFLHQEAIYNFFKKYKILQIIFGITLFFATFYDTTTNYASKNAYIHSSFVLPTVFGFLMIILIQYYHENQKKIGNVIKSIAFIGSCSFSIYIYNIIYVIWPLKDFAFFAVFLFGIFMHYLIERPSLILRSVIINKVFSKK